MVFCLKKKVPDLFSLGENKPGAINPYSEDQAQEDQHHAGPGRNDADESPDRDADPLTPSPALFAWR